MKDNSNILKKLLLAVIFSFMFIHMVHSFLGIPRIPPLKGDVSYPEKPEFMLSAWFESTFQQQQEEYINAMFGLRSMYVRLNNQVDFSFFKKVNANDVIVGKENYLYEKKYISAYYGANFMGIDSVEHIISQMKVISDGLKQRGKELVIIFAPGKASFYPEFIPDTYKCVNDSTNYKFLSNGAKNAGINVIDFNKWFVDNKTRSKYPLYPKYGIHWSNYGSVLAADSIINYIQKLRNIDLPNLSYDTIDMKQPISTDYDMGDGINLLFRLKSYDMAYAHIYTEHPKNKTKPNVLVISDSYFWQMRYFGIQNSFDVHSFWYYNKDIYSKSETDKLQVKHLDPEEEINKHDVIIIMATESNLGKIGWGALANFENVLNGTWSKVKFKKDVAQKKLDIQKDEDWMKQIEKKAAERNISVDSMVTLDAIWILQNY